MAHPTISVIIPAYNQARYVAEAIDSVLAQSAGGFEIIVVDDGSTDDTPAVLQAYGAAIRVVRQANQGLAGARNSGIRAAQAPLVALLDSDDAWQPEYLARMLALAGRMPETAVFYCGVRYVDAAGQPLPQPGHSQVVPPDQMLATLLRANFLVPSTILMRRAAVTAAGLFDPDFRRLQDWELWIRMLRQGHRFAGIPDQLVRYRLHDESLSTDPARGQQAAMALAVKHFGADDGRWQAWPAEKRRMYGGVYRYHALTASLIRGGDWQACAAHLARALQIDPSLAEDLDLFYELALGTQPVGRRGTDDALTLQANLQQVAELLAALFREAPAALQALRAPIVSMANYAAALVAYNVGQFGASQRLAWRALRAQPAARGPRAGSLLLRASLKRIGVGA